MVSAADSAKAVALASLILHSAEAEITPAAVEKVLAKAGITVAPAVVKQLTAAITSVGLSEIIPDLANVTPTAGAAAPAAAAAAAPAAAAAAAAPKEEEENTDFGLDLF